MSNESKQVPFWTYAVTASLLQTLRFKDLGTYEHCLRVGEMTKQLAARLGLDPYYQQVAEIAGFLHDIGESTIDQDIVSKPTKLNPLEYEIVKSHVTASEGFIRPLAIVSPFFQDVLVGISSHHEYISGHGYPKKLQGDQIPVISRILLLLDSFDSMTLDKNYKKALTNEQAYAEIQKWSGIQFDQHIADKFLLFHKDFKKSSIISIEDYLFRQTKLAA